MLSQIQLPIIFLCCLQSSVLGQQITAPTLPTTWKLADDLYGNNIIRCISSADVLAMRPSLASIVPDSSIFILVYKFFLVEGEYQVVFSISLGINAIQLYGVANTSDFVNYQLIRCGEATLSDLEAEGTNYVGLANSWNYDCSNISLAVNTVQNSNQFPGILTCVAHQEVNNVSYLIEADQTCLSLDSCAIPYYFATVNISTPESQALLSLSTALSLQDAKNQAYDLIQYPPQMNEWKGADSPNGKCIRRQVASEDLINYCAAQQSWWNSELLPGYQLQLLEYKKEQIMSSDHILAIYSVANLSSWNYMFFDLKINPSTPSGFYEINGFGTLTILSEAESDLQQYVSYANGWMPDCSTVDPVADAYARGQLAAEQLSCVEFQSIGDGIVLLVYSYSAQQVTQYFAIAIEFIGPDSSEEYSPIYSELTSYTGEDLTHAKNYLYNWMWQND